MRYFVLALAFCCAAAVSQPALAAASRTTHPPNTHVKRKKSKVRKGAKHKVTRSRAS
jgi:hypothetical protein